MIDFIWLIQKLKDEEKRRKIMIGEEVIKNFDFISL